ncbi:MAG: helix-turn-helix transcriptional regulator [Ruminococcaceae bacterium]|nr:helix-turn-helix transcriptional regulator [Oscillospiraceae bacterium]
MYIHYEKLWKKLLDKKITKTDLCQMSGISTRTMAKLVKNQSVTTDTLIRICEALDCELSEIMEITKTEPLLSLYEAYKKDRRLVEEDEYCRLYSLHYQNREFRIKEAKKKASKRVLIHCKGSSVQWEQFFPSGIHPVSEKSVISDCSFVAQNCICLLLIDGSTVGITGLDEGRFLSASRPYAFGKLCVMSKAKFKLYTP